MKTLYLHIGTHKTGTTSIQRALKSNQELLRKKSLTYFSKRPNGSNYHNINSWFENYPKSITNGTCSIKKNLKKLSIEISKIENNIILSGEAFSYIIFKEELLLLKDEFRKYFTDIKIIIYLRRQDTQAVSHHNQSSKSFQRPSQLFWANQFYVFKDDQKHVKSYLNYYEKINMWADIFGEENIIIRIFDKKTLINIDVVNDFFNILGIDYQQDNFSKNESNCLEKTKIGLLANQVGIKNGPLREIINKNIKSDNKLLPKREDAIKFYNQFRESNILLNNRFNISDINEAIFDEDFSNYPEEGSEYWTEEIANETLSTILKNLDESYGAINYNLFFQAAIKLEKIDLDLSYKLISMINLLFPNDQVVKQKIQQYNSYLNNNIKKII